MRTKTLRPGCNPSLASGKPSCFLGVAQWWLVNVQGDTMSDPRAGSTGGSIPNREGWSTSLALAVPMELPDPFEIQRGPGYGSGDLIALDVQQWLAAVAAALAR